jgi:hypothetical protein
MQEANPQRKEWLNEKGHIRVREQIRTDARYPMRKAIAVHSSVAANH